MQHHFYVSFFNYFSFIPMRQAPTAQKVFIEALLFANSSANFFNADGIREDIQASQLENILMNIVQLIYPKYISSSKIIPINQTISAKRRPTVVLQVMWLHNY